MLSAGKIQYFEIFLQTVSIFWARSNCISCIFISLIWRDNEWSGFFKLTYLTYSILIFNLLNVLLLLSSNVSIHVQACLQKTPAFWSTPSSSITTNEEPTILRGAPVKSPFTSFGQFRNMEATVWSEPRSHRSWSMRKEQRMVKTKQNKKKDYLSVVK